MSIGWNDLAKGAVGLIVAVAIAWAGWLSLEVVDIRTSQASLHEKFGSVDARVTRISNRLPTEIALHTQELFDRTLSSAIMTSRAFFKDGTWKRSIGLYDNEQKSLRVFTAQVGSPTDHGWLRILLWRVRTHDDRAIELSVLDKYRRTYHVDAPAAPDFIDTEHSLLSSKPHEDIRQEVEKELLMRLGDPLKPVLINVAASTDTYRDLAIELARYEASYKP